MKLIPHQSSTYQSFRDGKGNSYALVLGLWWEFDKSSSCNLALNIVTNSSLVKQLNAAHERLSKKKK